MDLNQVLKLSTAQITTLEKLQSLPNLGIKVVVSELEITLGFIRVYLGFSATFCQLCEL